MNLTSLTRTATALVAGAALFATLSAGADAIPDTFNVSTTISASCSLTNGDGGPADLTPTYTPSTDSGTGSETVLDTTCTGSSPTVTFTDASNSGSTEFVMLSASNDLYYQISNTPSCTGVVGDNPITEGAPQSLTTGTSVYEICAAVIAQGVNTTAPGGSYTDTVTYSISP
jgi:hypothetical protein